MHIVMHNPRYCYLGNRQKWGRNVQLSYAQLLQFKPAGHMIPGMNKPLFFFCNSNTLFRPGTVLLEFENQRMEPIQEASQYKEITAIRNSPHTEHGA